MIVCSCHAVSDREIRRLARNGECSLRAVAQASGAGTCCGGCRLTVRAILDEVETAHESRLSVSLSMGASPEAI